MRCTKSAGYIAPTAHFVMMARASTAALKLHPEIGSARSRLTMMRLGLPIIAADLMFGAAVFAVLRNKSCFQNCITQLGSKFSAQSLPSDRRKKLLPCNRIFSEHA